MISDLMIELELPILKARSRDEYAMEQEMSPWSIGMREYPKVCVNLQTDVR